jgi:hypothetical protein
MDEYYKIFQWHLELQSIMLNQFVKWIEILEIEEPN